MAKAVQPIEMSGRIRSLVRWRAGFAVAAVLLPTILYAIFERQARRLDALAARGESVEAQVTAVSRDGTTFYAYRVAGIEHTWNVARRAAPFPVGAVFPATYLPDDPSFSRPIADRSLSAKEAARNRSFSSKLMLGVGLTLLMLAALVHRDLRRLRSGAPSAPSDPQEYKRRLALTSMLPLPAFVLIGGFHFSDAMDRGESIVPVVLGLVFFVGIIVTVFVLVGRDGPTKVRERSARLLRWVAPIAGGIAALRLIALLFGK